MLFRKAVEVIFLAARRSSRILLKDEAAADEVQTGADEEADDDDGVVEQLELVEGSTASNLFSISSKRASTNT